MSNNAVLNPSPKASATAAAAPSHAELLERARRISRKAEARAEQTDRERCIPRETIAELYDADLMRLVQPPQWGGLGRSFHELYELVYELARGCGSTMSCSFGVRPAGARWRNASACVAWRVAAKGSPSCA